MTSAEALITTCYKLRERQKIFSCSVYSCDKLLSLSAGSGSDAAALATTARKEGKYSPSI